MSADTNLLQLDDTADSVNKLTAAVVQMNQVQPDRAPETYVGPMKAIVAQARQGQGPGIDTPQAAKVPPTPVTRVHGTQFNSSKSSANTPTPPSEASEETTPRFSR